MSLELVFQIAVKGKHTSSKDLSTPEDAIAHVINKTLLAGTSNNQIDLCFHDRRTLADGVSEELDLAGSLTDSFGATITFAKVKAILVQNLSETQNLTIGGAAANAFSTPFGDSTDKIVVPPLGVLLLVAPLAGFAVTGATADLLKVENGSAGQSTNYNIILAGTSA